MGIRKKLHFWTQNLLPLVYDESLSYYEVVAKCAEYINGLIDDNDEIHKRLDEIQELIDSSDLEGLEELLNKMDELEEVVNGYDDTIEAIENKVAQIDYANTPYISATGEDLDNYKTGGIWYFTRVSVPANKPDVVGGGYLTVFRAGSDNRLLQVWVNMAYGREGSGQVNDPMGVYVRTLTAASTGWSKWTSLINYGNTVKKNNYKYVEQLISVANSYLENTAFMKYGNTTFLDTNNAENYSETDPVTGNKYGYIDCSAFIGLCMRGIKFQDTPISPDYTGQPQLPTYWKANGEFEWTWNPFDYFVSTGSTSYENRCRKASQFGKLMLESGQSVPIDSNFANIEPGDILFYASKNSDGEWLSNYFMHISHIAMCYSKEVAASGNFPYTHTIIDSSNAEPTISTKVLETSPNTQYLVMVCRPDLGAIYPSPREIPLTIWDGASGNPELQSGLSNVYGVRYFRNGNIGEVYLRVRTADDATPSNYVTIASGVDPIRSNILISGVFVPMGSISPRAQTGVYTNDKLNLFARVTSSGEVQVARGSMGTEYVGCFFYFTK